MDSRVQALRAFDRFMTRRAGVLAEGMLGSSLAFAEVRVLFEIGRTEPAPVAAVRDALDLDSGYLSRILGRLEGQGLVTRERSREDARRQTARLTDAGRTERETLDARASGAAAALLDGLPEADERALIEAMARIRRILGDPELAPGTVVLRPFEPGDYGWCVSRHGALYASEYGWNEQMEALVARIVAGFIEERVPGREAAWVAELDGERAGCVFCMRAEPETTAKLRLLLVEPAARGRGIGNSLVEQCLRFARRRGYDRMTLWTQSILTSAHRIYAGAGFELVDSEPHHSFGVDLVGQTWEREL